MIEPAQATSFLGFDDIYVQCVWRHPSADTEIIAIFRDVNASNNNTSNFLMDQPLRGPWTHKNSVIDHPAFRACSILAMEMFTDLNNTPLDMVKAKWKGQGGVVYDY